MSHLCIKAIILQDRPGTNIGKTQKNDRFSSGTIAKAGAQIRPSTLFTTLQLATELDGLLLGQLSKVKSGKTGDHAEYELQILSISECIQGTTLLLLPLLLLLLRRRLRLLLLLLHQQQYNIVSPSHPICAGAKPSYRIMQSCVSRQRRYDGLLSALEGKAHHRLADSGSSAAATACSSCRIMHDNIRLLCSVSHPSTRSSPIYI